MSDATLLRIAGAASLAGWLAGCVTVGPNFKAPAAPAVDSYTRAALPAATAAAPGALGGAQRLVAAPRAAPDWWRAFGSAKLDALVDRALGNSPTLIAAAATLRQARQLYAAEAGSTLYPTAAAKLGATREEINGASIGQPKVPQSTYTLYNTAVGVNYDFDLFGGNRRALEALAAQADYQAYEYAGARSTLAANVVTTAFSQAQFIAEIEATRAILAAQRRQLDVARQGFALGTAARADVLALRTQVELTRASLPPLRNRLEQADHLLAVLVGQAPGAADLPRFALADFTLPARLPLVVPSELVRERPDVQASIALLHAATAQYGVAVAALYPKINLSASLGSAALTTGALFGPGSAIWSLAGDLAQPLFNAGLKAGAGAAQASMQAVGANYQQTVLQALRNVADALRQLSNDAQILQRQAAAYATARRSLELLQGQYRIGAANYLQLLVAEQQTQQIRIGLVAARAARLADSAALYQAMGGGALTRLR
ncbi:MAG TPA: efflux transporter outer membrane subunit [Steroidobacteraceae bacterium]|nr:efflux transporter outer membrane subunit [Steroidobacteraceae bacterium]